MNKRDALGAAVTISGATLMLWGVLFLPDMSTKSAVGATVVGLLIAIGGALMMGHDDE